MGNIVEITVPTDQREGNESVIGKWLKAVGETVSENEPLLEINTDKVTLEVAAPVTGVLKEIVKKPKDKIELSEVLGRIEVGVAANAKETPVKPQNKTSEDTRQSAPPVTGSSAKGEGAALLSPAVKKALKDKGVSANQIAGSGKDGRVTFHDVENFKGGSAVASSVVYAGENRKVPHSPMRKSIAEHMVHSVAVAPHVTSVFQVDLSKVIADRESKRAQFESRGVKLTLTAYFLIATVEALKVVPEVNSRWGDDELEILADFNIGVAAAMEESQGGAGLVVPVIKQAQNKDLFSLAQELQQVTQKARTGKLGATDLKGGTFTISNHGVSGSLFAAPIIINQPQSAILGIGKLEKRVVVSEVNGKDVFSVVPSAYVTLTIDHRALDGFSANKFLAAFVKTLENWA